MRTLAELDFNDRDPVAAGPAPRVPGTRAEPRIAPHPAAGEIAVAERAPREPTDAAGFFFLLNALTRLGIARSLQADPELAENGFVVRLLGRLAAHAGVDAADPIFRFLETEIGLAQAAFDPGDPCRRAILRHWTRAVRRWCRRACAKTVREIAQRGGSVSFSRTDLDVTLPLDDADIRIRRGGLDIDPGWVPWFGRVVRFHYVRLESDEVQS